MACAAFVAFLDGSRSWHLVRREPSREIFEALEMRASMVAEDECALRRRATNGVK
jgi:hypothetical protein